MQDHIYHVYTKSIEKFKIFKSKAELDRFTFTLLYYLQENQATRLSNYLQVNQENMYSRKIAANSPALRMIAYCIMPTHIHLVLQECMPNSISGFMQRVLSSYSHYFNTRLKRRGPLWQSRFKRSYLKTDEQLMYVVRYVHLNPVTSYLVENPIDWHYSSYREYLREDSVVWYLCRFRDLIDDKPEIYKRYVEEWIPFQRELAALKKVFGA